MKRIVLTTFGSYGDLHPYIALAHGLQARGHDATIVTSALYRHKVEEQGIGFQPMRPNIAELGDQAEIVRRVYDPRRGAEYLTRELIMPYFAADLRRPARRRTTCRRARLASDHLCRTTGCTQARTSVALHGAAADGVHVRLRSAHIAARAVVEGAAQCQPGALSARVRRAQAHCPQLVGAGAAARPRAGLAGARRRSPLRRPVSRLTARSRSSPPCSRTRSPTGRRAPALPAFRSMMPTRWTPRRCAPSKSSSMQGRPRSSLRWGRRRCSPRATSIGMRWRSRDGSNAAPSCSPGNWPAIRASGRCRPGCSPRNMRLTRCSFPGCGGRPSGRRRHPRAGAARRAADARGLVQPRPARQR